MIRNYHILKHLVREFKEIIGFKITEIFSQEKDVLIFQLFDGDFFKYLIFDATPQFSSIYLSNQYSRAKANSVDLFPDVHGEIIQDIYLFENERILNILCLHTHLVFFLFGASKSNCLAVNKNNMIFDSFKKDEDLIGKPFNFQSNQLKNLNDFDDIGIEKALVKSKFLFSKELAEEFCLQKNIPSEKKISEFDKKELIKLETEIEDFIQFIERQRTYYLLKNERGQLIVSPITLINFKQIILQTDSISQCIYQKIKSLKIYSQIEEKKSSMLNFLNKELKKFEKKKQDIQLAEMNLHLEEIYKIRAIILSSQPDLKIKGLKKITLKDFDNNDIEIPLDEKLNLIENAQIYFQKSRNTRLNIEKRQKLLPAINEMISKINLFKKRLENLTQSKDLQKLTDELRHSGFKYDEDRQKGAGSKFRQFQLSDGFTLFVGKSATNNDELTFKFARPNDLWFHARGSSGAHAILPLEKNQKPTKKIIQAAASIAAFYSGMKNAKYVPVAYTHRKYIKKPKGANPGTVILMREDVIMVEPKLPESDSPQS